jgi:hypothetical protein
VMFCPVPSIVTSSAIVGRLECVRFCGWPKMVQFVLPYVLGSNETEHPRSHRSPCLNSLASSV